LPALPARYWRVFSFATFAATISPITTADAIITISSDIYAGYAISILSPTLFHFFSLIWCRRLILIFSLAVHRHASAGFFAAIAATIDTP
jgi:hypothetical protein